MCYESEKDFLFEPVPITFYVNYVVAVNFRIVPKQIPNWIESHALSGESHSRNSKRTKPNSKNVWRWYRICLLVDADNPWGPSHMKIFSGLDCISERTSKTQREPSQKRSNISPNFKTTKFRTRQRYRGHTGLEISGAKATGQAHFMHGKMSAAPVPRPVVVVQPRSAIGISSLLPVVWESV